MKANHCKQNLCLSLRSSPVLVKGEGDPTPRRGREPGQVQLRPSLEPLLSPAQLPLAAQDFPFTRL